MAGSDKRKQSLYFPEDMLKEIQEEANRQDRSLSWIVQKAWKIARKEIMKYPSVNEFPGEEDEKENRLSQARYVAAADGTAIYCETFLGTSQGPVADTGAVPTPRATPSVLLLDGIGCDGFIWRYLRPALAAHQVLHVHYRSHGRSARAHDHQTATVAQLADDAAVCMEAFGMARAAVVGHSMGVQVALELARRHPARVAGLGLLCGVHAHMLDGLLGRSDWDERTKLLQGAVQKYAGLAKLASRLVVPTRLSFELARRLEIHPQLVQYEDFLPYLIGITRTDLQFFFALLRNAMTHDASDVLPGLGAVPTVVMAGERDRFIPASRSESMAALIPGARYVGVEDGSHVTPIERADRVNEAVVALLAQISQN